MGVIAKGIPRGCQGLFTPVSLGYPLSVFNKNSTLKGKKRPGVSLKRVCIARPATVRLPCDDFRLLSGSAEYDFSEYDFGLNN